MSKLLLRKYPEGILRNKSEKLQRIGDSEKKLLSEMVLTMREECGVGLAAPQIGISKRVAVIEYGGRVINMVNPVITSKSGSSSFEEGCLSVPGKSVKVKRAEEISVSYTDENGIPHNEIFKGLEARIVQHEVDHLNGKLIIDYMPWYKRRMK